ncbi:MAG: chorismate-binding protein [Sediminicola sp.]|mgnify:CR=1 FL=1
MEERAVRQLSEQLPFVLYRKPGQLNVKGIFQTDDRLHLDAPLTDSGFLMAPFDHLEPSVFIMADSIMEGDYPALKGNGPIKRSAVNLDLENDHKDIHTELIRTALKEIGRGRFKKVVLSRKMDVPLSEPPLRIFANLLGSYASAFCYLWYHPKVGLWCGASPELLMSLVNQRFTTMSLAGTKSYVEGMQAQWGQKEKEEQSMVTDYIVEVLQERLVDLHVSATSTIRAGNLWHLRTGISGRLVSGDLPGLLRSLHPTPAVGGIPAEAAKDFILARENYHRGFYTGYLGEINIREHSERGRSKRNVENRAYGSGSGKTALYVNLRCMQLLGDTARIFVGGGITAESQAESEWMETVAKSETMLQVLQK